MDKNGALNSTIKGSTLPPYYLSSYASVLFCCASNRISSIDFCPNLKSATLLVSLLKDYFYRVDPEPQARVEAPKVLDPLDVLMGDTTTPDPSLTSPSTRPSTTISSTKPSTTQPPPTTTTTTSTTSQRPPVFRFPTLTPTILPPGVTASTTRMTTSTSSVGPPPPPPFTVVSRRTTSSTSVSASSRVHIQTPISQFSLNQGRSSQKHPAPHLRPSLLRLAAQGKKALDIETLETPKELRNPPEEPSSPHPSIPLTRTPPANFKDVLRLPRSNKNEANTADRERTRRHFKHLYRREKRQVDNIPVHISRQRRLHNTQNTRPRTRQRTRLRSLLPSSTNSDSSNINLPLPVLCRPTSAVLTSPDLTLNNIAANNEERSNSRDVLTINDSNVARLGRVSSRGRFRFIRQEEERRSGAVEPTSTPTSTSRRRRPSSAPTTRRRPQTHGTNLVTRKRPVQLVPVRVSSSPAQISTTSHPQSLTSQPSPLPINRPAINQAEDFISLDKNAGVSELTIEEEQVTTLEPEIVTTTTPVPIVYPETNFTCEDKITGGLYADIEAGCIMFHICSKELDGR